jgi:DNA-binding response OmpR family regulator
MARILICDDEPGLRAVIKRYAEADGHEATEAVNGAEAVDACKKGAFDIVIMDVMMPELDGLSAVREIRKTSDVPVIMLTARGEEYDKVIGFGLGVDDYVVKPFSSKELMLRVGAIQRRAEKKASGSKGHDVYTKGGLKADMTAYRVYIDDEPAAMAPKVYDLLFYLIRNKGIAVPRESILADVWGYEYCGDDRTLDTHMKLLRKALGPCADYITTLRGLGYRFES